MERIHPELYVLQDKHNKMWHILAVLLQSHGWMTLKIQVKVKVKGHNAQHTL